LNVDLTEKERNALVGLLEPLPRYRDDATNTPLSRNRRRVW
jgi:hypothetical protein